MTFFSFLLLAIHLQMASISSIAILKEEKRKQEPAERNRNKNEPNNISSITCFFSFNVIDELMLRRNLYFRSCSASGSCLLIADILFPSSNGPPLALSFIMVDQMKEKKSVRSREGWPS